MRSASVNTTGAISANSTRRAQVSLDDLFADVSLDAAQYLSGLEDSNVQAKIDEIIDLLISGHATKAMDAIDAAGELITAPAGELLHAACYVDMGRDDQAAEIFNRIESSDSLVLFACGVIQHNQGKLQQASEYFYLASNTLCHNKADVYYRDISQMYLAIELSSRGRLQSAADAWQLFDSSVRQRDISDVQVASQSDYLVQWGQVLFELGDCKAASEVLDMAFRLNKSSSIVPPMLIDSLLSCGNTTKARNVALEVLAGPGDKASCSEMLVKLFEATGETDGPSNMLTELTRGGVMVSETVLLTLAHSAWLLGQNDSAVAMLADNIEELEYPHIVAGCLVRWLLLANRPADALEVIYTALKRDSDYSDHLIRLVDIAPREAFSTGGIIESFIEKDPQLSPQRLYIAALAAERSNNRDYATELLEQACDEDNFELFPPAVAALCKIWADDGDINVYSTYAAKFDSPDDLWFVRYLYGCQMAAAGNANEAMALFESSLANRDSYDSTRIMLAELQASNNMFGRAMSTLSPAVRLYYQLDYAITLAGYYDKASKYYSQQNDSHQARAASQRALDILHEVLGVDPAHPAALSSIMMRSGAWTDFIESDTIAERLYALGCRDTGFLYIKAICQARLGSAAMLPQRRYQRAVTDITDAIKTSGRTRQLVTLLAELHANAAKHEESAEEYIRMRDADGFAGPDGYTLQAAMQYLQANMTDAAEQQFELIKDKLPNTDIKYLYFSLSPDKAKIDTLFPSGPDTDFWRAVCIDKLSGGGTELVKAFASQVEQADVDAYGSAAIANTEDYAKFALKWFTSRPSAYWLKRCVEQIEISNPLIEAELRGMNMRKRFVNMQSLSCCTPVDLAVFRMLQSGKVIEAVGYCQSTADELEMLAQRDSTELAEYLRANLLVLLKGAGNNEVAERMARKFVKADDDSLVLLTESLNVLPAGSRLYNQCRLKALKLNPLDSTLNNNLAYEWLNRGVNLKRCSDMLHRAKRYGSGTHIEDSLGWLMYKRGWLPRARRQLEAAVNASDGDSSVIYDHLGDVYWRLGYKDRAVKMWNEAADLCQADVAVHRELLDNDSLMVGQRAEKKISAARAGKPVPVAPLGEGVK